MIVPTKNFNETKYVFHCLLSEFLGYKYEIVSKAEIVNFILQFGQKEITIRNNYFAFDDLYTKERIPNSVQDDTIDIDSLVYPLVSLFGDSAVDIADQGIMINSDIIASTFFMLTRWEEYVSDKRDDHNRFPLEQSLACKLDFQHRPIVNEYVDILAALLKSIGYNKPRKERTYEIVPTHDIDSAYMFTSTISKIRSIGFSTIKKPSITETRLKLKSLAKNEDPYDTYNYLMDLADKAGVKSHFFFMSGGDSSYDANYSIEDSRVVDLIKYITRRKHSIGIHPSYESYNNPSIFYNELETLRSVCDSNIATGRQHYLRFSVPHTWQMWDQYDMTWDSTLGYSGTVGFRCGVCYSYPVYDIENRKQLALRERPLIVMDVSLVQHENLSVESSISKVKALQKQVMKHNGEFVFLWHNSSFGTDVWKDCTPVLKQLYRLPAKNN